MNALAKGGELDRAFQVFEALESYNAPLDVVAYTVLMDGCVRAGQLERAWEILDQAY